MHSSPAAWAAWVVKRPALVLPLTALVMGFWAPVRLAGTGEPAVKPDSASGLSPEVDPEQRWRSRRRLPGGGRRGRADYEPRGKRDVQGLELVAIHKPDQQADCHAA